MKTPLVFLLILFLCPSAGIAQTEADEEPAVAPEMGPPHVAETLQWLIGSWNGAGTQGNSSFTAVLTVTRQLDGTAVALLRESSGGYKELITLGYDIGSTKHVATLFNNRMHTGVYVCNVSENEVLFSQVSSVPGFRSERKITNQEDGTILYVIEGGKEGEALRKLVDIRFQKSSP